MSYEQDRITLVFTNDEIGDIMRAYDQSWLKLKYLTNFYNEMVKTGNTRRMTALLPEYFGTNDLVFELYNGDIFKLHHMYVTSDEAMEYYATKPKSRKQLEYYIINYMQLASLVFWDMEIYSLVDGYMKITKFREVVDGKIIMNDTFDTIKKLLSTK